jgi:predicted dehydrogenase
MNASSIGIGFVGAGWMGSTLLKRLVERDDVHIVALCGRTRDKAEAVLKDLGLSTNLFTDDYEAMLQNPEVQAVFICSPNGSHGKQSIKALEAGKHVFCEKPCATKYSDYLKQIELERANPHLITFVDYLLNFDTMETQLKQRVADGEFGQVTQIQVNYRHPVNIDGDKRWKLSKDEMGDAIGMGIIHSLSVMVNLMASQAKPVSVFARGQQAIVRPFEPDAIWSIMVGFDNAATGVCLGNIDTANGYDAYHNIQGSEGAFIFDSQLDRPQKIRMWSDHTTEGKWIYPLDPERCATEGASAWPEDTTTPDSGDVMNHQTQHCVAHFIECIKTGTPSPLSFAHSAAIAEIGWAALISAQTDRPVKLPLNEEHARQVL